jgi:Trp operon repressor
MGAIMKKHAIRELSSILAQARDEHELSVLLEGMLTPQEIEDAVVRWKLILKLKDGETQRDIAHALGISLGKIARGSRLLQYGPAEFSRLVGQIRERLQQKKEQ